jgi:heme exporter protein A
MSFAGEGLSCVRGDRLVFHDVGFAVHPGEVLILRGPNGAGKSTLLRVAATLLRAETGQLTWNGEDVAEDLDRHRRRLCFVAHADAVKPALTVRENIVDWVRIQGGEMDRVPAALEHFGISHLADTPAQYLSAGQRRRTGLARLAAMSAPLWLLDEPTVSLDDDGVACLQRVVGEHRAKGGMVMAATHIELGFGDSAVLRLGAA